MFSFRVLGRWPCCWLVLPLGVLTAPATPGYAQRTGTGVLLSGAVRDARTLEPVAGAAIGAGGRADRVIADADGRFTVRLPPGAVRLRIWRIGYAALDTLLVVERATGPLVFDLRAEPIRLGALTVESARRASEGGEAERALFHREAVPGVVGVSGRELREVPALAAPDVLRSLQALPGVLALNDLSAQLHVRGGGPDQNLFLLDGARIFAPYHLFGMFGAFNADAVERVEFFRGTLPARHGGALSAVVAIEQREGGSDDAEFEGGASLLGVRLAARGAVPWAHGRWLAAARRSHADLVYPWVTGDEFPYAFYDLQGRLSLAPAPGHRVRVSGFTSYDRFRLFLGGGGTDLQSRWRNGAGSLTWTWDHGQGWSAHGTAWGSLYRGTLVVGSGPGLRPTTSRVGVAGVRLEAARRGDASGLRLGLDVETGRVDLAGSEEPDSYIQGRSRATFTLPAVYVEAERWLGPVRLAPGLRLGYEAGGARWLLEPRLAARAHLSEDIALTVGAGRSHQVLSTLRDDRYILPGPPMWFLHPAGAPASRADGVDASLDAWRGRTWSYHAGAYARRFRSVPRWRPEGTRELSRLAFDDGQALGLELMIRRHEGALTGWIGYGLSTVRLAAPGGGDDYLPAWDRRHAVDLALFWRTEGKLSFSARMTCGSGLPFWPIAGSMPAARLVPIRVGRERPVDRNDWLPVWAKKQQRLPALFRIDLSARSRFLIGSFEITPYLSIQNVTARHNVLYYELKSRASADPSVAAPVSELVPVSPLPFRVFPSIGVDIAF